MSGTRPQHQPIPQFAAEFTTPEGRLAAPWYRWFITLWRLTGAQVLDWTRSVFFQTSASGNGLEVFSAADNSLLGSVAYIGRPGAPAEVQTLVASPFVFGPTVRAGVLVVSGGQAEVRRSGIWFPIGLVGGVIPVLPEDSVRVSWFGPEPPPVVFLPNTSA